MSLDQIRESKHNQEHIRQAASQHDELDTNNLNKNVSEVKVINYDLLLKQQTEDNLFDYAPNNYD